MTVGEMICELKRYPVDAMVLFTMYCEEDGTELVCYEPIIESTPDGCVEIWLSDNDDDELETYDTWDETEEEIAEELARMKEDGLLD